MIIGEVTIEEAADILTMSRCALERLLDNGEIPYHMVGGERRLYVRDVLEYKKRRNSGRWTAFKEYLRVCRELGIYDLEDKPMPEETDDG